MEGWGAEPWCRFLSTSLVEWPWKFRFDGPPKVKIDVAGEAVLKLLGLAPLRFLGSSWRDNVLSKGGRPAATADLLAEWLWESDSNESFILSFFDGLPRKDLGFRAVISEGVGVGISGGVGERRRLFGVFWWGVELEPLGVSWGKPLEQFF